MGEFPPAPAQYGAPMAATPFAAMPPPAGPPPAYQHAAQGSYPHMAAVAPAPGSFAVGAQASYLTLPPQGAAAGGAEPKNNAYGQYGAF